MRLSAIMSKDEMTSAVAALDQALYVHEKWSESVYCSLICQLAPDERDLADNPHLRCPFGQWYYAQQDSNLSKHPGFVAVEFEHVQLHRLAAMLLTASHGGSTISVRDYESFVSAMTRMRTEIISLRHEIVDGLTNLDPLTGATSRIGMLTKLRTQQELVKRELQSCTIAMMDLDHFKDVNDNHGHQAGDSVLVETVHWVLKNLRPYDELFRYGGEEFLLCEPETDLDAGHETIERLRTGIAALPITVNDGPPLRLTASFGITLLDQDVPVEESIARADRALYRAKAAGRNQTHIWDPSLI